MKIYIAGKITGDAGYFPKFAMAQAKASQDGHIVLNPAWLPEGMEPRDYMRICFAMIDAADVCAFLPDWEESCGARLERAYCEYIGKRAETWND